MPSSCIHEHQVYVCCTHILPPHPILKRWLKLEGQFSRLTAECTIWKGVLLAYRTMSCLFLYLQLTLIRD